MTSREKVIAAEQRVRAVINGELARVDCPFCGLSNDPKTMVLCCNLLADVVDAILDHVELKTSLEVVDQVMERAAKIQQRHRQVIFN